MQDPCTKTHWEFWKIWDLCHRCPTKIPSLQFPESTTSRWHATWNLDDISVAAGWEAGDSGQWSPEMHAVADGDVPSLV